jgi:hypothetical protein
MLKRIGYAEVCEEADAQAENVCLVGELWVSACPSFKLNRQWERMKYSLSRSCLTHFTPL